jgi:murein DD-endopeptidase MepM/ murein hydrolase activator NlpD
MAVLISAVFFLLRRNDANVSVNSIPDISTPEKLGRFVTYIVKPGDTFQGILSSFGIPAVSAFESYTALASIGLSRIFPGDSLVLTIGQDSAIIDFSLLTRLQCWYHINKDNNFLTAEKQPLTTEKQICVVKGVLSTCLSEDLNALGVGDAVVSRLAYIFAWDINFFVDPRKGDRFEVVFEKLYREGRFVTYGEILAAIYENNGFVHSAYAFKDTDGAIVYYNEKGSSLQKEFLKAPLKYRRISSGYSLHRKHPILGIVRPHLGIDYSAPSGTPVYAAANGVITFSGVNGGYGKYVTIRHGNAFETNYGHLHQIGKGISPGVKVAQGQLIGTVGATGLATGPHLDYRMKKAGKYINPVTLRLPSRANLPQKEMPLLNSIVLSNLELLKNCTHGDKHSVVKKETSAPADSGMRYIKVSAKTQLFP